MKKVITVVAAVVTFALSNATLAGQPAGAAMVSTKVIPQATGAANKVANTELAAIQIKSFQWGSSPARTSTPPERVVKAENLAVKPSVITWPDSTGGTKSRPVKRKGKGKGKGDK